MWHLYTLTAELKESTNTVFLTAAKGQGAATDLSLWGRYPYVTSENQAPESIPETFNRIGWHCCTKLARSPSRLLTALREHLIASVYTIYQP